MLSLPTCFELGGVNPVRWGGWCWPCLDAAVGVGFSVGLCILPEAHIPGLSLPLSQASGPSLATILPSISQDPKQTAPTLKRKGKDGQPLPGGLVPGWPGMGALCLCLLAVPGRPQPYQGTTDFEASDARCLGGRPSFILSSSPLSSSQGFLHCHTHSRGSKSVC